MSGGRFNSRIRFLLLIISIFAVSAGNFLYSQDSDTIPVPLYIDKTYTGEISVIILPDESVQIRPSELIAYLEDLMTEDALNTARTIFPETGWLDLTDMAGLGVRIIFSFEDLTIRVTIPAHLRRETTVSLKSSGPTPEGTYLEQANFSAFMNLELWNRFTYESGTYDFSATPEIGLNIFDWVVEARGSFRTTDIFYWDYSRLVKDFGSIGYRLEVGDLTVPVTGLTGVSRLLGASFRKNYSLSNAPEGTSAYSIEFFLREPSKVEIYMNDRKIRENDYQSGSYIFKDFPCSRGINRISIRWEDSEGPHEESLVIPFEGKLLRPGDFDLGIAIGLPDRKIVLPAFTSYQYLGITDNLTFGLGESFNIDTLELSIHPDFLLATNIGSFNLVPIWSINFNGGQNADVSFGYQMLKPGIDHYLNFGANLSYDYNSIAYPEVPLSLLSLDGYFNFNFGSGFGFSPKVLWGWRFDENRQIMNTEAILKKSIRGGSAITASVGLEYNEELSFSATISYSSSFPDANQNLYIQEDLVTQRLSAFWTKYKTDESNLAFNASTELPMQLDDKLSFSFSSGWDHPLFGINGGHNFNTIIDTSTFNNSTFLSANSSLVFAEGHFMITKKVNDSFVIVAPGPEFSEQTLRVNPRTGGSDLEISGSPGVMSNLSSFSVRKLWIEPEELPLGMDASGMKYLVLPSYKSAFVVTPKADVRFYIGGFLTDPEGNMIEASLGRLTGKNNGESVDFFTDDTGYFEAYGLSPDEYQLQLNGFERTVSIDLKGSEGGYYDAGTLIIPEDK